MAQQNKLFLEIVAKLKKLCFDIPGVNAWILETKDNKQVVIMSFDQDFSSKEPHINECSQWGIVINGNAILYTNREQRLTKGDSFFIPSGTPHRVEIKAGYTDITLFDGLRYKL